MPWEKKFNMDDAIDRATAVFWAKGYESTSLADLLKAIGVNKGSFYNAFGSKKQLFSTCLLKYEQEQRCDLLADLEALNAPLTAIETLFDQVIAQSAADDAKKGCFIVNTALDLPNHDEDTQQVVKQALHSTELFFRGQITLGIETEVIPASVDPVSEAKGLLTLLMGLRLLARGVFDQSSLVVIKAQALKLIQ